MEQQFRNSLAATRGLAGELGVIRAGPAVAADAVGPGGMACVANKVRQPPEARPYRGLVGADGGPGWRSEVLHIAPPRPDRLESISRPSRARVALPDAT